MPSLLLTLIVSFDRSRSTFRSQDEFWKSLRFFSAVRIRCTLLHGNVIESLVLKFGCAILFMGHLGKLLIACSLTVGKKGGRKKKTPKKQHTQKKTISVIRFRNSRVFVYVKLCAFVKSGDRYILYRNTTPAIGDESSSLCEWVAHIEMTNEKFFTVLRARRFMHFRSACVNYLNYLPLISAERLRKYDQI